MTVSSAKTRGYMQQAIAAFKKADKPVPNNLNEAADEVRALDPMLGMQLQQALQKDEYGSRVSFQRALADVQTEVTAGSEQARHQMSGTSFGARGLYFPADLHARITKQPLPEPEKPKGLVFSDQMLTTSSTAEKQIQEKLFTAYADISKRTATENLSPAQVKELKAEAEEVAVNDLLAVRDSNLEQKAKDRKIDELPFIVRTLVRQVQAWSQVGQSMTSGGKGAGVAGQIFGVAPEK